MEVEQERLDENGRSQTTTGSESEIGGPAGVERTTPPVSNGEQTSAGQP